MTKRMCIKANDNGAVSISQCFHGAQSVFHIEFPMTTGCFLMSSETEQKVANNNNIQRSVGACSVSDSGGAKVHKKSPMKLLMRNKPRAQERMPRQQAVGNHLFPQPEMMMTMMIVGMVWLMGMMVRVPVAYASGVVGNTTCKHATNMWGDPNPNIFYVCSAADQQPLQLQCPQGHGFFNGLGHLGCLPYERWPACRLTAEQASAQLAAGCDSSSPDEGDGNNDEAKTKDQPWATADPNRFYMCPGVSAAPLLLSCASGKGFVQTALMVGCADWPQWRRQMQCEDYF